MAEPTPRDTLLDHAYEIADKYGLAALSVRGLASDCNVSVGTIYNHFASKGELTTATTALYFKRAFYTDFCHPTKGERYLDFCKRMFDSMEKTIRHFREHWLKDSEALPTAEKTIARFREEKQFDHICEGMIIIFKNDPSIRHDLPAHVTAEAVSKFTLRNIIAELRSEQPDCSLLFTMLERTLYEQ